MKGLDITKFWEKVDKTEDCWNWKAYKFNGYGKFMVGEKYKKIPRLAHRISYVLYKGRISNNKQIDHLCRNRACVNPEHLQAVSQRENLMRGNGACAMNARKVSCPKGHAYTRENTLLYKRRGNKYRKCRKCRKRRFMRHKDLGRNLRHLLKIWP